MFDEDEEELALLEQYEQDQRSDRQVDADSDTEDRLMSMLQYGTGALGESVQKEDVAQKMASPMVISGSSTTAQDEKDDDMHSVISIASQASHVSISSSDDSMYMDEIEEKDEENPVVRHLDIQLANLTQAKYMDEEDNDSEEESLNLKLQGIIDSQIRDRSNKNPHAIGTSIGARRPPTLCFTCHIPGHNANQCERCLNCGERHSQLDRCYAIEPCHRCKQRGHMIANCPNERNNRECKHCHGFDHTDYNCMIVFQAYEGDRFQPVTSNTRYCYECAQFGHYGDDCPDLSRRAQSVPSIFRDEPFPASLHELRQTNGGQHDRSKRRGRDDRFDAHAPFASQLPPHLQQRGQKRGGSTSTESDTNDDDSDAKKKRRKRSKKKNRDKDASRDASPSSSHGSGSSNVFQRLARPERHPPTENAMNGRRNWNEQQRRTQSARNSASSHSLAFPRSSLPHAPSPARVPSYAGGYAQQNSHLRFDNNTPPPRRR
ncbi:hypothetical protein BC940DRAFT_337245 [Gongronella butleri]|nr:hypothetical protein BC940DRAFT_337245 [Gongronella butleri]